MTVMRSAQSMGKASKERKEEMKTAEISVVLGILMAGNGKN